VGSLDHQRKADALGLTHQQVRILILTGVARDHRHARCAHEDLGAGLGAHLAHRRRARPDEFEASLFDRFGKICVFAQEAETRVDRFSPAVECGRQDALGTQIGFGRRRGADPTALVGPTHMLRARVGIRIDRDGRNPEPAAAALDAARDFAAVCDEDFAEHGYSLSSLKAYCAGRWLRWAVLASLPI